MTAPILLAVPNVSEGRSAETIAAIGSAFTGGGGAGGTREQAGAGEIRLLDVHSDADHHRSVFTLAGAPEALLDAMMSGAAESLARIDVMARAEGQAARGQHPHVGALDVAPIVYLDAADRGAACAAALVLGDRLGAELELPVFLYGELTSDGAGSARTRAELRRGGLAALALRMRAQSLSGMPRLHPDFGPAQLHRSAGATLVAAREPLVAFNLQLAAPATVEDARVIAAAIREGGERGMPGLRAIGVALSGGVAQVSMNVERPLELPLAAIIENVRTFAPLAGAELVGLAPAAALERFPEDLPMPGFDPARHVIENALGC